MGEYLGGTAGYVKFGATVLSNDYRTFETAEGLKLVDATAGNDTNESFIASFKNGSASVQMLDQTGGSALWAALVPGTSGTLEWAPEGTASTKPKHTATAIVENRKRSQPYDDVVVLNVDFKFTSTVTDTAY